MILETRSEHWADEAACAASAAALARRAGLGDAFIELHGQLGAGKTTFVRHLLQALGVRGRVKSPTYAVLESYDVPAGPLVGHPSSVPGTPGRLAIQHFDFYRFDDPQEWEDAGFRELFAATGLKLAEWPDKAGGLLPLADLQVFIEPVDGKQGGEGGGESEAREVRFIARTALGVALLVSPSFAASAPPT